MIKQQLIPEWMQLIPELKTKSSLLLLVNTIPIGEMQFHPPAWLNELTRSIELL